MTSSPLKSPVARAFDAVRQPEFMRKALSFGLIGLVNFAVDLTVFLLALRYLTSSLIAANLLAWMVAVTCSYAMNSFFTFAAESGRKLRWREYFSFAASGVLGVIVNTAVVVIAANFLPLIAAKILAIGAGFLVNFSMSHFFVFRPRKADGDR
jgi:putative flippase GtrA